MHLSVLRQPMSENKTNDTNRQCITYDSWKILVNYYDICTPDNEVEKYQPSAKFSPKWSLNQLM